MSRVLIAMEQRMMVAATFPQFARALWLARQICVAHGYEYDMVTVGNNGATYSSDAYDFVIVPRLRDSGSWGAGGTDLTQFYDGTWGKPAFVLSTHARFVTYILDNVGTNDTGTNTISAAKLQWGEKTLYGYYIPHTIADGADVTPIVTNASNSAQMAAWRVNNVTNPVYCDASNVQSDQIYTMFHILLQTAIDNGDVSAPPAKAKIAYDLDDFPDATNTLEDATSIHDLLEQHGFPLTIGINPAIHAQVDSEVLAYCASKSPENGGYFYPIIHNTTANFYLTNPQTNLESANGVPYLTANGFTAADDYSQGGYLYFPNNGIDDDFMRLASGYGVKVGRLDELASAAGRLFEPIGLEHKQTYKGVRLVGSTSQFGTGDEFIEEDSAEEITDFSISFGDALARCPYGGQIPYMHGENVYNGHDGGNAPGLKLLGFIAGVISNCPDTAEFVHPKAFA